MGIKLKNNAIGYLATAISASDVGVALESGDGALFPTYSTDDYSYATLESPGGTIEIVKVTARTTDTFTIVRAQEGTTAASFPAGSTFELRPTVQSLSDFITQTLAPSYDPFTGDGSTMAFTLSHTPTTATQAVVSVNGAIKKYTTDYTISGTTLTFVSAPANAAVILVRYIYSAI